MVDIRIYDFMGQKIYEIQKNAVQGNNNYYLNLSHLQPGLYIFSIAQGQKTVATQKFIKEN